MHSLELVPLIFFLLLHKALSHSQCGGGHPPSPNPNYVKDYDTLPNDWDQQQEYDEDDDNFDGYGIHDDDEDESNGINVNMEDININYHYDPEKRRQTYDYGEHGFKMEVDYLGPITEKEDGEDEEDPAPKDEEKSSEAKSAFDFRDDAEERLRPHYALDHRRATKMALVGQKVYIKLSVISLFDTRDKIPSEDSCYTSLKKYLAEFELDTTALNGTTGFRRAKNVSANPLLTYRMIRRVVLNLTSNLLELCALDENNREINDAIESSFKAANLSYPTNQDLNDALLGLTRIQFVYGYNASDLRAGRIGDLKARVFLNFEDSLLLVSYLMELEAHVLAYQWLSAAEVGIKHLPKDEKMYATERLEGAWQTFLTLTKLKEKEVVHRAFRGRIQQNFGGLFHTYEKYATCRGVFDIPADEAAELLCFLDTFADEYWTINPLKVELLKYNPPVWMFHDFISENTITYIKTAASPSLVRSGVVSESKLQTEFNDQRTSMLAWLYDNDAYGYPDPVLRKLNKRMELLTGLEIIKSQSSHALQVVDYGSLGGHYEFHNDALEESNDWSGTGDRIATLLMFLSDVPLGGYTAFPILNIAVRPEKGSAVLWFPLLLNSSTDIRTLHGGCPVSFGTKLVANKWILHNENFLKYQCSLNPDV